MDDECCLTRGNSWCWSVQTIWNNNMEVYGLKGRFTRENQFVFGGKGTRWSVLHGLCIKQCSPRHHTSLIPHDCCMTDGCLKSGLFLKTFLKRVMYQLCLPVNRKVSFVVSRHYPLSPHQQSR